MSAFCHARPSRFAHNGRTGKEANRWAAGVAHALLPLNGRAGQELPICVVYVPLRLNHLVGAFTQSHSQSPQGCQHTL